MPRGPSLSPSLHQQSIPVPLQLQTSMLELPDPHCTVPEKVRLFDSSGNLTARQIGVNTFRFRRLTLFYLLRAQSWLWLLSFSIILYLGLLMLMSTLYYGWSVLCGAHAGTNAIRALYFTVVSLAANGGYLSEDARMTDSTRGVCFTGRTYLVMLCSYVNIIFVGLVAALVVSKATYTGHLSNRIVFSNFCTVARIPSHASQHPPVSSASRSTQHWRLTFRMANVENKRPLANGTLRLYCVTAESISTAAAAQPQNRHHRTSAAGHEAAPHHQTHAAGTVDAKEAANLDTNTNTAPKMKPVVAPTDSQVALLAPPHRRSGGHHHDRTSAKLERRSPSPAPSSHRSRAVSTSSEDGAKGHYDEPASSAFLTEEQKVSQKGVQDAQKQTQTELHADEKMQSVMKPPPHEADPLNPTSLSLSSINSPHAAVSVMPKTSGLSIIPVNYGTVQEHHAHHTAEGISTNIAAATANNHINALGNRAPRVYFAEHNNVSRGVDATLPKTQHIRQNTLTSAAANTANKNNNNTALCSFAVDVGACAQRLTSVEYVPAHITGDNSTSRTQSLLGSKKRSALTQTSALSFTHWRQRLGIFWHRDSRVGDDNKNKNSADIDRHDETNDDKGAAAVIMVPRLRSELSRQRCVVPEHMKERVRVKVSELRWGCPEEVYIAQDTGIGYATNEHDSYNRHAQQYTNDAHAKDDYHRHNQPVSSASRMFSAGNELSLWYPVTITHVLDERSPLYHLVNASLTRSTHADLSSRGSSTRRSPCQRHGSKQGDADNSHFGQHSHRRRRHHYDSYSQAENTEATVERNDSVDEDDNRYDMDDAEDGQGIARVAVTPWTDSDDGLAVGAAETRAQLTRYDVEGDAHANVGTEPSRKKSKKGSGEVRAGHASKTSKWWRWIRTGQPRPATNATTSLDEAKKVHRRGGQPVQSIHAGAHAGASSAPKPTRQFQIVAVFSATEIETGALIMATHTYTATNIITESHFSSKLIYMNPYDGEVLLDYHYFNEILPVSTQEQSPSDPEFNGLGEC